MTKSELIDHIAEATGLTKIETEAVVEGFMLTVMAAVEEGGRVELRGFGSFRPQKRAARTFQTPQSGEPVHVPARVVPVFRPSAAFRERVAKASPE